MIVTNFIYTNGIEIFLDYLILSGRELLLAAARWRCGKQHIKKRGHDRSVGLSHVIDTEQILFPLCGNFLALSELRVSLYTTQHTLLGFL